MSEVSQPVRLAFHEEVHERARQFAQELLEDVPEVEGVAVVASFNPQQEHVPHGVVIGRCGPLRNPAELMHMAVQLHGTQRHLLEQAHEVIHTVDAYMRERHDALLDLENKIRERQRQLAEGETG